MKKTTSSSNKKPPLPPVGSAAVQPKNSSANMILSTTPTNNNKNTSSTHHHQHHLPITEKNKTIKNRNVSTSSSLNDNLSLAAIQLMHFTSESGKDFQEMLRAHDGLTHVDMVGMQLDAREWLHAISCLEGHPTVQYIDLHGIQPAVTSDERRQESLLSLIEKNKNIIEVLVDEEAFQKNEIFPRTKINLDYHAGITKRKEVEVRNLETEESLFHHYEEQLLVVRLEQQERMKIDIERETTFKEKTNAFFKAHEGILSKVSKHKALATFFEKIFRITEMSCKQRYVIYMTRYLEPFGGWRIQQENVGRSSLMLLEEQVRHALRKRYFNSHDMHLAKQRQRQRSEAQDNQNFFNAQNEGRQINENLEKKLWEVFTSAVKNMEKREADLERALAHRLSEDERKKQAKLTEIAEKRQTQQEKMQRELMRLQNIHSSDTEKLFRLEKHSRGRILLEEPEYWNLLFDFRKVFFPLAQAEENCGNAHRRLEALFHKPVSLDIQNDQKTINYHFPAQNKPQLVVPHLFVEAFLEPSWEGEVQQAVTDFNWSLKDLKRVRSHSRQKEALVFFQLSELTKKHGVRLSYHPLLYPLYQKECFSTAVPIVLDDDFVRKKLIFRGGEVSATALNVATHQYNCTFSFDSPGANTPGAAGGSTSSSRQSKNNTNKNIVAKSLKNFVGMGEKILPNSTAVILNKNGLMRSIDVEEFIRSCSIIATIVPGCKLPFVQKIKMMMKFKFANLRTACGQVICNSQEPYTLTKILDTYVIISRPLISIQRSNLNWSRGREDAKIFEGLRLDHPAVLDATKVGEIAVLEANRPLENAEVHLSFKSGLSVEDTFLLSSSCQFEVIEETAASISNSKNINKIKNKGGAAASPSSVAANFVSPFGENKDQQPAVTTGVTFPAVVESEGGNQEQSGSTTSGALRSSTVMQKRRHSSASSNTGDSATNAITEAMLKHNGPGSIGGSAIWSTTPRVIKYEDMEIGYLVKGTLESLDSLRKRNGYDFVYNCYELCFMFGGKYATIRRVERFLREITFFNRSNTPTLGPREISVALTLDKSHCESSIAFHVELEHKPFRFSLPTKQIYSTSKSNGDVLAEHIKCVPLTSTSIMSDAKIAGVEGVTTAILGGSLRVFLANYKLGDRLELLESIGGGSHHHNDGITLVKKEKAKSASNSIDNFLPEVEETTGKMSEKEDSDESFWSVMYQCEEVAVLRKKLPTFMQSGDEKVGVPMRPKEKEKKKRKKKDGEDKQIFETELNWPPLEVMALSGAQELWIEFSSAGCVFVETINAILRNIAFCNGCLMPKLGERLVLVELVINSIREHTDSSNNSTPMIGPGNMDASLSPGRGTPSMFQSGGGGGGSGEHRTDIIQERFHLHVTPPFVKLPTQRYVVKYLEGCGWKLIPGLEWALPESAPLPVFNGGSLELSIIEGWTPTDHVWIRSDEMIVEGGDVEISLSMPTSSNPPSTAVSPLATPPPLKANASSTATTEGGQPQKVDSSFIIYRTATIFDKYDNAELGKIAYDGKGKLIVHFVETRPNVPYIKKEMMMRFLRSLSLICTQHFEEGSFGSMKALQVVVTDAIGRQSHVFLRVVTRTEDDPSEFLLTNTEVIYRHSLCFSSKELFSDFMIAPPIDAQVYDPDTEFFDGGYLSCEFGSAISGVAKGDTFYFLPVEAQRKMYQAYKIPPRFLISVTEDGFLLDDDNSKVLAKLHKFPHPDIPNVTNLRINFQEPDPGAIAKSIVPLSVVSYMLNCIAFVNLSGEKCRYGKRNINLSISDGSNPKIGVQPVTIIVQPPLVAVTGGIKTETFYFVGAAPITVCSKIFINVGKEEQLTNGFIEILVDNPTEIEALYFSHAAFANLSFESRPIPIQQQQTSMVDVKNKRSGSIFSTSISGTLQQTSPLLANSVLSTNGAEWELTSPTATTSNVKENSISAFPITQTLLYDNHNIFMGKLSVSRHCITLQILPNSKLTPKHIDTFLRSITYENKDIAAAKEKVGKIVKVRMSDGLRGLNAFNEVDVLVNIGFKGK